MLESVSLLESLHSYGELSTQPEVPVIHFTVEPSAQVIVETLARVDAFSWCLLLVI